MRGVCLPSHPSKSRKPPPPILEVRYKWILLKDGRTVPNPVNRSYFTHAAAFGGFNLSRLSLLRKFNPIRRGGTRPISAPITQRSWLSPAFTLQRRLQHCLQKATA